MPESKHPFFSVIAVSFGFAMGVWFLMDTFIVAPLNEKISDLENKAKITSYNIKTSETYQELQSEVFQLKESAKFYKNKADELSEQASFSRSMETENGELNKILTSYKEALSNRDKLIKELEEKTNVFLKISELQKEQKKLDEELKELLRYHITEDRRLEIIRLESRIKMLQEQITALSSRAGNA